MNLRTLAAAALIPMLACSEEPPPPPTIIDIKVTDATSGAPVPGAQILFPARQATGQDGRVSFEIEPHDYIVRIEAPGYISAPEPFGRYVRVGAAANVTTATVVTLEPRPGASGTGKITGKVTRGGAPVVGALVLAASTVSAAGVTDADGKYSILGLAPNLYRVEAFFGGHKSSVKMNVSINEAEVLDTDLELTADPGATIGGALGMGTGTTTIAVVLAATGDPVPGLAIRQEFGGNYAISGVPPGRYRVRAALELDDRVIDPEFVRKTPILVEVADTSSVTQHLPTAPVLRGLRVRTGSTAADPVTFSWQAVDGAAFYVVEVSNLAGQVIWGGFDARLQPNLRVRAPDTSVDYGALVPPLERLSPNKMYRVRVFAGRDVPERATFELLAGSEELEGRFRAAK